MCKATFVIKGGGFSPIFLLSLTNVKYFFVFIAFFATYSCALGQKSEQYYFELNGTINADSGILSLNFFSEFTPSDIKELHTQVHNKKFSLSGYISEPQGVFILFDNRYMSQDFILDKGVQTITINVDSTQNMPAVNNLIMKNEYPIYSDFFKEVANKKELFYQKSDSLEALYDYILPEEIKLNLSKEHDFLVEESDELLLKYSKENPNSYIALWKLIRLMSWGYEPIFDSIYNALSSEIKNEYAGKVLQEKLKYGKLLSVGSTFPMLQCISNKNEPFSLDVFAKNEFTLVDFWYSSCGPCRAQFESLKCLYKQYSTKGFEIVGISIDNNNDRKKLEKVIIDNELSWLQYWDINGKETHKLSIHTFPTNFLVDKTGKIIMKNISMESLKSFLSENIK